jgi:molybdopterin-binding protein
MLPSRYEISARNRFRGTIEEVVLGNVMAHIVVRVGDNVVESVITRRSAEEMKLKKGDTVTPSSRYTGWLDEKGRRCRRPMCAMCRRSYFFISSFFISSAFLDSSILTSMT